MRKIMKVFTLFLMLGVILFAASCGGNNNTPATIDSISVVSESVPTTILTTELDDKIDDIKIEVKMSDGEVKTVYVSKSMISSDDYAKLANEGTYTITINYEGFTTSLTVVMKKPASSDPDPKPDPSKKEVEYSVLVKDIAGKPLSEFFIIFELNGKEVATGYTGGDGLFTKTLEANYYDVYIEGKDGYYLNQDAFETDLLGTQIEVVCEIDSLANIHTFFKTSNIIHSITIASNTRVNSYNTNFISIINSFTIFISIA